MVSNYFHIIVGKFLHAISWIFAGRERPVTLAGAVRRSGESPPPPSPFILPTLLSDGKPRMSRPRPHDEDNGRGRAVAPEREKAMQWMILDGQSVR